MRILRNFPVVLRLVCATAVVTLSAHVEAQTYTFDSTAGGWVDQNAGLVWGYNTACVSLITNYDWISCQAYAENYLDELQSWGEQYLSMADEYYADAEAAAAAGDTARADFYYALSDEYLIKGTATVGAATDAAGTTGWRSPTIEEAEAALVAGLFDIDRDPVLDPNNPCDPQLQIRRWTASTQGKKAYYLTPIDGTVDTAFKTSFGIPLVVRSLNPDSAGGTGGGNGHGKP